MVVKLKNGVRFANNSINISDRSASLSVAVIGGGYWGKNLIRIFHELGVLKIVCDLDKTALLNYKKQYSVETATDYHVLLADPEIDAIIIAAPAILHYQIAKDALLNGKDVFVEKPLALKVKEGEELVTLAKKHKRILMVGHILLYHNAIIKIKQLIDSGEIGDILYIYSNRLNIGKLRREENVLWSFAPHDISVILHLLGEFPLKIEAFASSYINKNIPDITITHFKFKKTSGHIFVSWLNPFKEQKLTIIGSKKMLVFDDIQKEKLISYTHVIKNEKDAPLTVEKDNGSPVKIDTGEPLKNEALHFLDCVKTRRSPRSDGREALRVLKVLSSAQKNLM